MKFKVIVGRKGQPGYSGIVEVLADGEMYPFTLRNGRKSLRIRARLLKDHFDIALGKTISYLIKFDFPQVNRIGAKPTKRGQFLMNGDYTTWSCWLWVLEI